VKKGRRTGKIQSRDGRAREEGLLDWKNPVQEWLRAQEVPLDCKNTVQGWPRAKKGC
jgi:hypothetical protein